MTSELALAPPPTDLRAELDHLAELASDLLRRARAGGADQAEVSLSLDAGLAVNVRRGEIDTLEYTRDRGVALTVYQGAPGSFRKGVASTADLRPESLQRTLDHALAIARHTEADPAAGLADPDRLATDFPDLDLWHPSPLDPELAIELARRCEAAGLQADARIENSEGASHNFGQSVAVYANSHGFVGREAATRCSLSAVLIAGSGERMQRDYDYDSGRALADLRAAELIGREAARRTVARLNPRPIRTGQYPVLFPPELARGLIGHVCSAASGGALYRKASFLLDQLDAQILPDWLTLTEQPQLPRAPGSANFDAEGVATRTQSLVDAGRLRRYLLGSYSARKLGLQSTGNAGGMHNMVVTSNAGDLASLISATQRGLLVTELMGQGVNMVTGDYSRGASGFWIEDGQIAHPVQEITIAGRLQEMLLGIEAIGNDVDHRGNVRCGSILVGRMMVAGGE
jgi:PmbA protein